MTNMALFLMFDDPKVPQILNVEQEISNDIVIEQAVSGDGGRCRLDAPNSTIDISITINLNTSELQITALGVQCPSPCWLGNI
jgi:spore germination protein YaaH